MSKEITGTFAADGSSTGVVILEKGMMFLGGSGGTDFGGGTVTLQFKGPDGAWYGSADTYTAADSQRIDVGSATEVRLTLAGATDPDLDYAIVSDTPEL
jgi:hypothetical protein